MADDPARTTAGSHLPDSTSLGLFTAAIPGTFAPVRIEPKADLPSDRLQGRSGFHKKYILGVII
jgi:hypothetical protein